MHPVYEISNMPDIQRQKKHYKLKARHRLAFKKEQEISKRDQETRYML